MTIDQFRYSYPFPAGWIAARLYDGEFGLAALQIIGTLAIIAFFETMAARKHHVDAPHG